jgi:hypothetical protein
MSFLLYSRFFSTLRGPVPPTIYLSCSLLPPSTPPLGWSSLFTLPIACQDAVQGLHHFPLLPRLNLLHQCHSCPPGRSERCCMYIKRGSTCRPYPHLLRSFSLPAPPPIANRHNAVPESFAVRNGAAKGMKRAENATELAANKKGAAKKNKNKKGGKKASNKKVQNADNQAKGASLAAANDKKANAKDKANKKANKNKKADKKKATKRNCKPY